MPAPIFLDEPLIVPLTPAETLARLTRVLGALPTVAPDRLDAFRAAQEALLSAYQSSEPTALAAPTLAAQELLVALYETVKNDAAQREALGFSDPELLANPEAVEGVNIATVVATFTIHGKQVLTSLAFERSANAMSYWLHEVRHFAEAPHERVEDPVIQSYFPLFPRLRVPPGTHIFRIKARNPSTSVISDEFTIEVPAP